MKFHALIDSGVSFLKSINFYNYRTGTGFCIIDQELAVGQILHKISNCIFFKNCIQKHALVAQGEQWMMVFVLLEFFENFYYTKDAKILQRSLQYFTKREG